MFKSKLQLYVGVFRYNIRVTLSIIFNFRSLLQCQKSFFLSDQTEWECFCYMGYLENLVWRFISCYTLLYVMFCSLLYSVVILFFELNLNTYRNEICPCSTILAFIRNKFIQHILFEVSVFEGCLLKKHIIDSKFKMTATGFEATRTKLRTHLWTKWLRVQIPLQTPKSYIYCACFKQELSWQSGSYRV